MVSKKVKSYISQLLDFTHSQGVTQLTLFGEKERFAQNSEFMVTFAELGDNLEIDEI